MASKRKPKLPPTLRVPPLHIALRDEHGAGGTHYVDMLTRIRFEDARGLNVALESIAQTFRGLSGIGAGEIVIGWRRRT